MLRSMAKYFFAPAAIERGASISLNKQVKQLKCPDGSALEMEQKAKLYYLNSIWSSKNSACFLHEWHKILGHCNYDDVQKLENVAEGINISNYEEVKRKVCTVGKICQFRNRSLCEGATAPLKFVHCDLAAPVNPVERDGFQYALSFVDDCWELLWHISLNVKRYSWSSTAIFCWRCPFRASQVCQMWEWYRVQ